MITKTGQSDFFRWYANDDVLMIRPIFKRKVPYFSSVFPTSRLYSFETLRSDSSGIKSSFVTTAKKP